ncbi:MAG TPA: hypothetical protein VNV25_10545 [Gemmatimonadaceae bacterium]|nr:hypothetical protein [Gemmatimonadaceae bacterium]
MTTPLGLFIVGLASIIAGILDLIWGEFEPAHQPIQAWGDHIPGQTILAYITAVCLIVGGVALLWPRTRRLGAVVLAIVYGAFTVFWLPRLFTAPTILGYHPRVYFGVLAGLGTQLIVVAALVGTVPVNRWIFGLSSIAFGLAHVTNIEDNATLVPKWMPLGGNFWVVLTGVAFILAGVAILTRVKDVLASQLLAVMFLVFSVIALVPLPIAHPHDHTAWGGNAYNLAAIGATWIFASMLRSAGVQSPATGTGAELSVPGKRANSRPSQPWKSSRYV